MKSLSILMLALVFTSCLQASPAGKLKPVGVTEVFFTSRHREAIVDSMATWKGPNGEHWLISTCKGAHYLRIEKALNGAPLKRIGGPGNQPGQFNYPNGITVVDDLLLVVERDNQRVQVLTLPGLQTLTSFGETELLNPYGIYIRKHKKGDYSVYVSDSYVLTPEATRTLDRRIKKYRLRVKESNPKDVQTRLESTFGASKGDGRLLIVESLYGDPAHDRLLIADEDMEEKCVKIYSLDGQFTGKLLGKGLFHGEPEGIALYRGSGKQGFWILTDQGKSENYFHLFDRQSLEYIGSFFGPDTLNTDGIWMEDQSVGNRYPAGLFFALQNDGNVAAFDWRDIAAALHLETGP